MPCGMIHHTIIATVNRLLFGITIGLMRSTFDGIISNTTLSTLGLLLEEQVDAFENERVDADCRGIGLLIGLSFRAPSIADVRQFPQLAGVEPERKAAHLLIVGRRGSWCGRSDLGRCRAAFLDKLVDVFLR